MSVQRTALTMLCVAFHSPLVAGAVEPLNLWLSEKPHLLGKPSVPFLSSAFGDYLPDDESLDAKYWVRP